MIKIISTHLGRQKVSATQSKLKAGGVKKGETKRQKSINDKINHEKDEPEGNAMRADNEGGGYANTIVYILMQHE